MNIKWPVSVKTATKTFAKISMLGLLSAGLSLSANAGDLSSAVNRADASSALTVDRTFDHRPARQLLKNALSDLSASSQGHSSNVIDAQWRLDGRYVPMSRFVELEDVYTVVDPKDWRAL